MAVKALFLPVVGVRAVFTIKMLVLQRTIERA